jgi:hypothetical protein
MTYELETLLAMRDFILPEFYPVLFQPHARIGAYRSKRVGRSSCTMEHGHTVRHTVEPQSVAKHSFA